MRPVSAISLLVLTPALCARALAQADQATDQAPKKSQEASVLEPASPEHPFLVSEAPWQIDFEPAAWFVGAGGRLKMPRSNPPGPSDKVDIASLNLDNPRFVPFGELNVRKGDWRVSARGWWYDATKDASGHSGQLGDVSYSTPDTLRTTMQFGSFELEGAYTLAGKPLNETHPGVYAFDAKLDMVVGLRLYDVDWKITNLGSSQTTSESDFFLQPLVGAKLSMDLWTDITMDIQLTFGGVPFESNTSYSADIVAGFMYRPTPHVGVQIGYRSLFYGVGKGSGNAEFDFNGAMQGLYGGIELRF
jgi:hypothetical protein